jgi:hypothetical protein
MASIFRIEELSLSLAPAGFLLGLLFDIGDEGDKFFRNVGLSPNHTLLQPRREFCS